MTDEGDVFNVVCDIVIVFIMVIIILGIISILRGKNNVL